MGGNVVRLSLAVLFIICAPAISIAAPRSAADCAAIANPFAYNECIALFGPKVGQSHFQPDAGPASHATAARSYPAAGRTRRVSGPVFARRAPNGRYVAEFQVGRPPVKVAAHWHRHRRY
jgi:hypothetical protein